MSLLLWDASALTKRYVVEQGTPIVNGLFDHSHTRDMVVTYLGYAETAAVIRRRWNRGTLTEAEYARGRDLLEQEVLLDAQFTLLTIEDAAILEGVALTDQYNLNASDAAILAAYLRLARDPSGAEDTEAGRTRRSAPTRVGAWVRGNRPVPGQGPPLRGRMHGMSVVQGPSGRIRHDVLSNLVEIVFVSHDVLIVVPLPQPAGKRWPALFLNAADIGVRGHRLEPLHDIAKGWIAL